MHSNTLASLYQSQLRIHTISISLDDEIFVNLIALCAVRKAFLDPLAASKICEYTNFPS